MPLIRIENSQKSARGVSISDLSSQWIDDRAEAARRECNKLHNRR
ncbi:pyocin activator PrtN family protein [Neorhizobium sp. LMR1-1-1.1]